MRMEQVGLLQVLELTAWQSILAFMTPAQSLKKIYRDLSTAVDRLSFGPPTTHVYNPLNYAWALVDQYLELAALAPKEAIFLGMNPGPWGMAQTGVPFGTASAVGDWMHIQGTVERPCNEHPKRPVLGLEVNREEVSGQRFWGWARARFGTPHGFFAHSFVANYCPLMFLEASGRNRTPDKLPAKESKILNRVCDAAFRKVVAALEPRWVIGIGGFAEKRARAALQATGIRIGRILHPSPASPAANRGWQTQAEKQLVELGVFEFHESAGCGAKQEAVAGDGEVAI